jgi:putative endonuclease
MAKVRFIQALLMIWSEEFKSTKLSKLKGLPASTASTSFLYFESFTDINDAIAAEKQIKGWTRKKKLELIRTNNPMFRDLTNEWL